MWIEEIERIDVDRGDGENECGYRQMGNGGRGGG